jgi:protein involved in temperature-dependent protein secretion
MVEVAPMSADQLIEQGDYKGALDELRQATSNPQADPAQLLSRFSMEVRLQEFDAAENTMKRLCAAAPDAASVMSQLGLAARAERLAIQRQSDAALAGKRATVGIPPPHAIALVKLAIAHAQHDQATAKAALEEVRAMTPATSGTIVRKNGATLRFTKITDTDDLTGASLPCYEGPQLLDISYSELRSVTFSEPKTSFDVMWPRAEVVLVTGEVLRVRVPALYPGSGCAEESHLRTGRETTWTRDKGYAEGHGQRDLSLTTAEGNSIVGLLSIASMTFDNPTRVAPGRGGLAIQQQDRQWTATHKAVAWLAGILAAVMVLRASLLYSITDEPRFLAIGMGLVICGCVGWLTTQFSTKGMAAIAVVITFVVTTLKWVL